MDLISQLKVQLEELESYAYESGDADTVPSNVLLDRQRIVMGELILLVLLTLLMLLLLLLLTLR